jgi:hypothetical protein
MNSDGTFWIGRNGVNTIVESGPRTPSSGRSYSIYQGSRDNMLASLSGTANPTSSQVTLQAHKVGSSHATKLRLMSIGDMAIKAAGGGSANGILNITAHQATRFNSPMTVLKNVPEASGPVDLVENTVWSNASLKNFFDNPSNETELAKKMKGVLWIDTSDNYNLRSFDPSEYDTSPANAEVDPYFTYYVADESSAGEVTFSFQASTTAKNTTVKSHSWDFVDGGGFSEDGSGPAAQYTYEGTPGSTETVTVKYKVTHQPDDSSQSKQESSVLSRDIEVEYPDYTIELPDPDPPSRQPIFRPRDDVRRR